MIITPGSQYQCVFPPFIGQTASLDRYLVESKLTGLLGPGNLSCRPLSDLSSMLEMDPDSVRPLADPTPGPDGEVLRLVLADQFLDAADAGLSLALRANIEFFPFQFRPWLKYHGTAARRLLIADETGLGKTIEAGVIIAQAVATNPGGTVVILSPRSVVSKWRSELGRRFGIWAVEGNLRDFDGKTPPPGVFVVSHGNMPSADSLDIQDGALDLLVIDEVHRFIGRTGGQKRRGRAMCLSRASKGVLGLSATPIQIEMADLQRILNLLVPGEFPESGFEDQAELQMAINRIIATLAESEPPAQADIDAVSPYLGPDSPVSPDGLRSPLDTESMALAQMHLQSIGPIGRRMTRARASDPDVGQSRERIVVDHVVSTGVLSNLIERMDDCMRMMRRHSNRQQLASCPSAAPAIISGILGSDSPDDGSDWADDYVPPPPSSPVARELEELKRQAEIEMPNSGPKISELLWLLDDLESREEITKAVVFTHWMPTLRKAQAIVRTAMDCPVYAINRGDDQDAIDHKTEKFRSDDGFAVMFVSDRMSTGIDLEMANVCINMDLPYNPAVLQQRIGRLDRIIQESDFIEIHNLILAGSVEEDIREAIEERIEVFRGVIGGMEHIIEPDDTEAQSDEDADEILALIRREADTEMVAQSEVLLYVLDSLLDGEIAERRKTLHPLHARGHLIISAAMQRLGAETEWDEGSGTLSLRMDEPTRMGILSSKAFFPRGPDYVYAAFERSDEEGTVTIPMRGKDAIIGPMHPLRAACTRILLSVESMQSVDQQANSDGLLGLSTSEPRWKWVEDGVDEVCNLGSLTLNLSDGSMSLEWRLSDGPSGTAKSAHGEVVR